MRLHDLQNAFAAMVFGGDIAALTHHIRPGGASPQERFAVYRNNVRHNLREGLRAVYPVVEKLVGERFFDYAAERYLEGCPSTSGDIHQFGGSFPDFLSAFPPAAQLAYLPDTARLEWVMHEVFHAPGHAPLSLALLGRLPAAAYADLRFVLHPACRLLSSHFPVHRIWEINQPSAEWEGELDVGGGGVSVLVRRDGFAVEAEPVPAAEFVMLQCLADGATVGAAYDYALQADEAFDLVCFLRRHIAEATIVDFRAGAGPERS